MARDTILFWKKELTERSVLEYIEKIICRYGHLGTYDEVSQFGSRTIVIRHRLGRKGSKFFEGYLRSALQNIIERESVFEVTDSSVKFDLRYESATQHQKHGQRIQKVHKLMLVSGVVRIPPSRLKHSLKDTAIEILQPPHWKLRKIWKSLQFLYLFRHPYGCRWIDSLLIVVSIVSSSVLEQIY